MGCDESVTSLVARALLAMVGMGWLAEPETGKARAGASGRSGSAARRGAGKQSAKPVSGSPRTARTVSAPTAARLGDAPASRRPAVTRATEAKIDERIGAWRQARDFVAIGNLGEQVAVRALTRATYEILATQRDLQGAVPLILGKDTRINPEDLVVVMPGDRYGTVNVKATASESTSGSTASGDLTTPRMSKGQNLEQYYALRAGLQSPLDDGRPFGQVMKVDLIHKKAQVFDIGTDGRLTPNGGPVGVLEDVVAVCLQHPEDMPAPTGPYYQEPADGQGS